MVVLIARNQVQMEVEHGLPGCGAVVLHEIVAVALQFLRKFRYEMLCQFDRIGSGRIINLVEIRGMCFRKDQRKKTRAARHR